MILLILSVFVMTTSRSAAPNLTCIIDILRTKLLKTNQSTTGYKTAGIWPLAETCIHLIHLAGILRKSDARDHFVALFGAKQATPLQRIHLSHMRAQCHKSACFVRSRNSQYKRYTPLYAVRRRRRRRLHVSILSNIKQCSAHIQFLRMM